MSQAEIHRRTQDAFAPVAANYARSVGHGDAAALAQLVEWVAPAETDRMLDIATGPGHVALAFAPYVAEAVALDLTPSMLEQTQLTATERGLGNVRTVEGLAEALPFADASFDIVAVRLAPHHYADVALALREMVRVAKPGGKLLIVDTTVPEDPSLDAQINAIEMLRDPSHVRNYRPSEWRAMLAEVGAAVEFEQVATYSEGKHMPLEAWFERIRTPLPARRVVRDLLAFGSPELREALQVEGDGMRLPQITLVAKVSG